MTSQQLQQKLFSAIVERFASKQEAVSTLQQVLNKSPDGIYRRLRGATALTIEEIAQLAVTFGISMDALIFEDPEQVLFSYRLGMADVNRAEDYLDSVLELAEQLTRSPSVEVKYTTQEIPVFSYYCFPELLAFKMFVYGQTYWNLDGSVGRKFQLDDGLGRAGHLAQQVARAYLEVTSTELWSPDLLHHTLHQVLSYLDSEQFQQPADALRICQSLRRMIRWIERMAGLGYKFMPGEQPRQALGEYHLYVNSFTSTNDTLLVSGQEGSTLITSFGMPNFLQCEDRRLCEEIDNWMQALIQRSTYVTRVQSRYRELFFKGLLADIDRTEEKVNLRISR